jgi:hypothetical protein
MAKQKMGQKIMIMEGALRSQNKEFIAMRNSFRTLGRRDATLLFGMGPSKLLGLGELGLKKGEELRLTTQSLARSWQQTGNWL